MGLNAYNELIMVSRADDRETILGLMRKIYENDPKAEFSLLNIYKELPIVSSSPICEIKKSTVEFVTNATQLSIISEAREVLIQSNFMNTSIIGKVKELDHLRLQVTLGDFSFAEVHADKRIAVRVRLKLPMQVQLMVDGNQLAGVIHDVSLGGALVRTFAGDLLEQAKSIHMRIKLMHAGSKEMIETLVPSRLVRIDKSGVEAQCAMVFNHTAQSERVLATFIYQRQLEIIKELRSKI